jgi:hypothetical protein
MQTVAVDGGRYKLVNGVLMELLTPKIAMKRLGISKPTFTKWLKEKIILKAHMAGEKKRYFITDGEVERVKNLMSGSWKRGKSKLPKKAGK